MASTSNENATNNDDLPTNLVEEEPSPSSEEKPSLNDEEKKQDGKVEDEEKKGGFKDFLVLLRKHFLLCTTIR